MRVRARALSLTHHQAVEDNARNMMHCGTKFILNKATLRGHDHGNLLGRLCCLVVSDACRYVISHINCWLFDFEAQFKLQAYSHETAGASTNATAGEMAVRVRERET